MVVSPAATRSAVGASRRAPIRAAADRTAGFDRRPSAEELSSTDSPARAREFQLRRARLAFEEIDRLRHGRPPLRTGRHCRGIHPRWRDGPPRWERGIGSLTPAWPRSGSCRTRRSILRLDSSATRPWMTVSALRPGGHTYRGCACHRRAVRGRCSEPRRRDRRRFRARFPASTCVPASPAGPRLRGVDPDTRAWPAASGPDDTAGPTSDRPRRAGREGDRLLGLEHDDPRR